MIVGGISYGLSLRGGGQSVFSVDVQPCRFVCAVKLLDRPAYETFGVFLGDGCVVLIVKILVLLTVVAQVIGLQIDVTAHVVKVLENFHEATALVRSSLALDLVQ